MLESDIITTVTQFYIDILQLVSDESSKIEQSLF